MLDLFTAWAATGFTASPLAPLAEATGDEPATRAATIAPGREHDAERLQGLSPYGGGTDPLHLSAHCSGPLDDPPGDTLLLRSTRTERTAVLLLDSMQGWYRALTDAGPTLPPLNGRSWRVEVIVRPIGHLGTYRRSRRTGLWFAGRHRHHTPGN
ncbi:MAG: hypothetical protein JNK12_12405 [Acidimicrobiales bacterium]|nr:hypothetical protein [Acidimicrobiales bacterium]